MVVTTSPLVKTYTLQEFWELPEPGDHSKLELIKGVLYMSPPPAEIHDEAFNNLTKELVRTLDRAGYRGSIFAPRVALWIDEDTYLEPDLMYVSDELKAQMTPAAEPAPTSSSKLFRRRMQNTTGRPNRIPIARWASAKCGSSNWTGKKSRSVASKRARPPSTNSATSCAPKFFPKSRFRSPLFFPDLHQRSRLAPSLLVSATL